MRRAERLFRLVNELRARKTTRARDLAEYLEVSLATIYRDISHLQASGLPIDGEAGVGYVLRPGFDIPNITFTYDQIDALAIGLAFVEQVGDPTLVIAAREARAKIQAGLPMPEERKLADAPYFNLVQTTDAHKYTGPIRQAIRNREVLHLTYKNGQDIATDRRVQPLLICNFSGGWMFAAWCEFRQEFRTFRFDRISSLTKTDDVFDEDPKRNLTAFMASTRR